MKKHLKYSAIGLSLLPLVAVAQETIDTALQTISGILTDTIIPLLIVIATVIFLWGVVQYVTAGGDEERLKNGRNLMIFGIIALAVMISVWGIAKLLVNTFGVGGKGVPTELGEV